MTVHRFLDLSAEEWERADPDYLPYSAMAAKWLSVEDITKALAAMLHRLDQEAK